jgi:hypothetical protein
MSYLALVILVNRTVIRVDSLRLTVRNGPLPWAGARDVPTGDIDQFYCEEYVSRTARGGTYYRIKLVRKSGDELDLVSGLPPRVNAGVIIQHLKGYLGDRGRS